MADKKKLPLNELIAASSGPYRMLYQYLKPYRGRFILGLICGVAYAILNGLIPLVIYFVASQVFGTEAPGGGDIASKLPGPIADIVKGFHLPEWAALRPGLGGVLLACILVPLVTAFRAALSYANSYFIAWTSFRMLRDLRRALFAKIVNQSLAFFNKAKAGKLISRVSNDTRVAQSSFIDVATNIFRDPISVITGVGVLLFLDWKFCLVMLILFPVCIVPIAVFGRKVRKAGKAEEDLAGAMAVILQESFTGIRTIKAFAREKYQTKNFDAASNQQFQSSMRVRKSMDIVQPLIETVSGLGIALALLYIYFYDIEVARIIALLFGTFLLYEPVKKVSRLHLQMQKALAASTNVFDLLRMKMDVQDTYGAREIENCGGPIEFENVTFAYGNDEAAIRDVTTRLEAGKQYALVGASGAGKSTILSLILRFYDPQQGIIRIGDVDLREYSQNSLRNNVGLVSQETFLFHDTIAENIRFGRLDANQEEIEQAAKMAFAHDFILAQADGYQTIIGDKGCLLSGGQQQRISIARALLKNAPILLLDEATSALDSESERMIQSALERLTEGKTTIAIAHRLSTILKSDQIIVMDKGQIVDSGKHAELLTRSAIYRRLYELQFHHSEDEQPSLAG